MRTLLTGGTGYIGSAVLDALLSQGHDVLATVRSERAAAQVIARGARAVRVDLFDVDATADALSDVDAAVHTAAPSDRAADLDDAVVGAVIRTFGDGRPFVYTSGLWVHGAGIDLHEASPTTDAPDLVAWRVPVENRLASSPVDARVLVPGVVYGRGKGLMGVLASAPRTADGALRTIGDGEQHWTWVHVDDLASLYVLALRPDFCVPRVIASDGSPTAVRAVAAAIAGADGVAAESPEQSRARLGDALAEALLLDQRAHGTLARDLGWAPQHRSVLHEVPLAVAG